MLKAETLIAVCSAVFLTLLAFLPGRGFGAMQAPGDAERGALLYDSRCIGCHSLQANRIGPRHNDVFGRQIGALGDFDYSPALAASTATWDAETLDRWLADPERFLPGQRMNFMVDDPQDRRDLIAFLRSQARR